MLLDGAILPVLLAIFGRLALFAYLLPTSARRLVTVCSVAGSALIPPARGVLSYALPALDDAYLAGNPKAFAIADEFSSSLELRSSSPGYSS